jgi:CBS domain containing-hemolysin-like protein
MRLDQAAPLIGPVWRNMDRTVGEQIIAALGRVPEPGEEAVIDGIPVEVEALEGDAIASVIVGERPSQDEDDA